MTKPRKLRVFLCHASQDKPVVRELHQRLKKEGWIDPWLDEEKLTLGQYWTTVIEEAIDAADIVLIFLSRNSVNKEGFVQRELTYAWELSLEKPRNVIFLIPFRLDECEVPRYLRARQWGDYFGEKKEQIYENLLRSLKQRHEQKLRLEAEEQAQAEQQARIQKDAEDNVRREREETQRKEAEARIHKEMAETDARQRKAAEQQRLQTPALVITPTPARPSTPASNKLVLSNGMDFVRVPAGKFLMGSTKENKLAFGNEQPQHAVDIPYDFWMARYPVTNELYNAYVKAKGTKHPVSGWEKKKDHPVTYVNWQDVIEYCRWLNNLLKGELPPGLILRLPGEAEWEKAARGEKGSEWPWGNTFDKNKCNSSEGGKGDTTPVGLYSPQGDSPFGCADMAGNVWEWTHSLKKGYPYKANDGREDEKASGNRALRGGSFDDDEGDARGASRDVDLYSRDVLYGFRVAASPNLS